MQQFDQFRAVVKARRGEGYQVKPEAELWEGRAVTAQADFDRLAAIERAYADTLALARKIIERHENLLLNERHRAEQAEHDART